MLSTESFAPCLMVPTRTDGSVAVVDHDARCSWCCRWDHPLTLTPRTYNGVTVALSFPEWIVYDWHVQHHQRGVPLA